MENYFEPVKKKHHNFTYTGSGNVNDLSVYKDENCVYSVWKLKSIIERLRFLFTGELTICVASHQLPPMSIMSQDYIGEWLN